MRQNVFRINILIVVQRNRGQSGAEVEGPREPLKGVSLQKAVQELHIFQGVAGLLHQQSLQCIGIPLSLVNVYMLCLQYFFTVTF